MLPLKGYEGVDFASEESFEMSHDSSDIEFPLVGCERARNVAYWLNTLITSNKIVIAISLSRTRQATGLGINCAEWRTSNRESLLVLTWLSML